MGTVLLAIAALGLVAWLVSSVNELHERFARESRGLGLGVPGRPDRLARDGCDLAGPPGLAIERAGQAIPAPVPTDVIRAASVQADQAEGVIRQVKDESVKAELNRELGELRTGREHREFHVVIFGTGSAGKTSLINALPGAGRRQDRGRHGDNPARREPHLQHGRDRRDRVLDGHARPVGDRGRRRSRANRKPASWPRGPTC